MINTGLLLRRPYESDYSALRRFLVANRFETNKGLKAAFAELGIVSQSASTEGGPSKRLWIADAAKRWEDEFCIKNGLALISRSAARSVRDPGPLRNCPVCATKCYHSELFWFPWVTRCPTHHKTIVPRCPTCKLPWPKPSELLSRRCVSCSSHLSPAVLASTGAFVHDMDTTFFDAVNGALRQYLNRPGVSLFAQYAGENQLRIHDKLPVTHLNWPSLVAYADPTLQSAFRAFGASLFPTRQMTFTLDPNTDPVTKCRSTQAYVERCVSQQFETGLKEQLLHRFGSAATDHFASFDFQSHSITELVSVSLRYWNMAISETPNGRRYLSMTRDHLVFREKIGFPAAPCLITHVGRELGGSFLMSNNYLWNAFPGGLTQKVQVWLYQCDLWWTFVTLFRAIEAFSEMIKPVQVIEPLHLQGTKGPLEEWPWFQPRYLLLAQDDGRFTIRVPEWVTRVSLDHLHIEGKN